MPLILKHMTKISSTNFAENDLVEITAIRVFETTFCSLFLQLKPRTCPANPRLHQHHEPRNYLILVQQTLLLTLAVVLR